MKQSIFTVPYFSSPRGLCSRECFTRPEENFIFETEVLFCIIIFREFMKHKLKIDDHSFVTFVPNEDAKEFHLRIVDDVFRTESFIEQFISSFKEGKETALRETIKVPEDVAKIVTVTESMTRNQILYNILSYIIDPYNRVVSIHLFKRDVTASRDANSNHRPSYEVEASEIIISYSFNITIKKDK